MNWTRGILLDSNLTHEERIRMQHTERSIVFSNFSINDNGRSREKVCILNTAHPTYEANAKLIAAAPDLL